jgi:hypothetical protein
VAVDAEGCSEKKNKKTKSSSITTAAIVTTTPTPPTTIPTTARINAVEFRLSYLKYNVGLKVRSIYLYTCRARSLFCMRTLVLERRVRRKRSI